MVLWHTMALTTAVRAVIRAEPDEGTTMTGLIVIAAQNSLERVFGHDASPASTPYPPISNLEPV